MDFSYNVWLLAVPIVNTSANISTVSHCFLSERFGKSSSRPYEPAFLKEPIMFGNFMKCFDDVNLASSKMWLIFFPDAMGHITCLIRMIQQERGNALLVRFGGTGNQSLTKLCAHICGYQCFQIELCDYSSFHDNLKKLYDSASLLNKPTIFLFTDTQIVVEEILEDTYSTLVRCQTCLNQMRDSP